MSIIQQLADNLILHHRYRDGDLLDKSGNGHDGTASGAFWVKRKKGIGINNITSASNIIVSDTVALRATTGTLVFYGDFTVTSTNAGSARVLYDKSDAGGAHLRFQVNQTVFRMFDGTSVRTISHTINNNRFIAVTFVSGEVPIAYVDGYKLGSFSGAITPSGNDADLKIGNLYTGGFPQEVPMYELLQFNTVLTDQQIAQLYEDLDSQPFLSGLPKRDFTDYSGMVTINYHETFADRPVTLGSALGSGEPFAGGTVQSGTWKIGADATGHHALCVTDGRYTVPLVGASGLTTDTFSTSGTPTLTKNTNELQIDAVAGEKIYQITITP